MPGAKKYFGAEVGLADPSDEPVAVTPNDDDPLDAGQCNYLYVGTGGDVTVKGSAGGAAITYKNVPSGAYLWVRALFVMATDTDATDIVAHY